jgi:hypothetical protein
MEAGQSIGTGSYAPLLTQLHSLLIPKMRIYDCSPQATWPNVSSIFPMNFKTRQLPKACGVPGIGSSPNYVLHRLTTLPITCVLTPTLCACCASCSPRS